MSRGLPLDCSDSKPRESWNMEIRTFRKLERVALDVLRTQPDIGGAQRTSREQYWIIDTIESELGKIEHGHLTTEFLEGLVDEGFIRPLYSRDGVRGRGRYGGLTPKGIDRLDQLQHPVRYWIQKNWFPFTIAVATLLVALVNVTVTVLRFLGLGS